LFGWWVGRFCSVGKSFGGRVSRARAHVEEAKTLGLMFARARARHPTRWFVF
jgi:hypothetical protein